MIMQLTYTKKAAQRVGDAEVEYWKAFREIGKIVYRTGTTKMEFPAEILGWQLWRPNWLWVDLTPVLDEAAKNPDIKIDTVAANVHLALCLMKIKNAVTIQTYSLSYPDEARRATLKSCAKSFMNLGWRMTVWKVSGRRAKLRIKRPWSSIFRAKPSADEILARGKWAATAFEALNTYDDHEVPLFIGEGARHGNFFAAVEW